MNVEICAWGRSWTVALEAGTRRLGGGPLDGIRIPGLPAGVLELALEDGSIRMRALQQVQVGRVAYPRDAERLLLGGERVTLAPEVWLSLPTAALPPPPATRVVLRGLVAAADAAPQGRAELIVVAGPELGRRVPLASGKVTLGRGAQAHVRVRDRSISRIHAVLESVGSEYLLLDAGGTNGLYLNGARVSRPALLLHGDVVTLGRSHLAFQTWGPRALPRPAAALRPRESLLIGLSTGMALAGLGVVLAMSH